MSTIDQQIASQLANIERASGRSISDWIELMGWLREAYERAG